MDHKLEACNVTGVVTKALLERKSNEEVLEEVKKIFPTSSTTVATVQWYRNKLRKDGKDVPTARELRREARQSDSWLD